jgi:hypothetical protein
MPRPIVGREREQQRGRLPNAELRDQENQKYSAHGEPPTLGERAPGRAEQQVAVEDALEQLRVDLDAGHAFSHRVRGIVR